MVLVSFSLVSAADYLPHKQSEDLYFSFSDTEALGCNISTLDTPNNNTVWIGVEMTKNGSTYSSIITKNNFSSTGVYCVNIECVDGYGNVCRQVTKTGTLPSVEESLIYLILAVAVFLLFALSFYFMLATPYSNARDMRGAVIQVTRLKYIKLGFIMLTWVLFTWFLNILIGLADNFVALTMYYGFFGFMFETMNRLALPLGIFIIVVAFFEIVRDANIMKEISKFGSASR